MARVADPFQNSEREPGIQRGRGGFMRNAIDVPYVTDPSGAVVKTGPRKGKPKRLAYGSPSGAGKLIENTYNLQKWGERMTVTGIGVDLALIADCAALVGMDRESSEYKETADRIVMRAKDAAKAATAAERGTHAHSLTEDHDEERDWIARAEAGEVLGVDLAVQEALVAAWREMLDREGLEILAVEASCVDDTWRLAGTLDRIARTTRELRFVLVGGEVRTIPADTVLVLDVKSGKRRTRSDGSVEYWAGYSVQIASYAQSVPYDVEAETRGEWPWPISQDHALIAHLDVLGAMDGAPSCELIYVDIAAGRDHGGACVQMAKAWGDRRDVFSVGMLAAEEIAEGEGDTCGTPAVAPSATGDEAPALTVEPVQPPSEGIPTPSLGGDLAPDEGPTVTDADIDALVQAYLEVPETIRKGWMRQLAEEARHGVNGRGRVPYQLGGATGVASLRRFEITRGLIAVANAAHEGGDEGRTELLRTILAAVIGDVALYANVPVGQAVGSMGASEAVLFARLATAWVEDPRLDDEARPVVTHLAATAA